MRRGAYKASDYSRDLYNDFSCLTPTELLQQARSARISLASRMALRVCIDQIAAARDTGDQRAADEYEAVRPAIESVDLYPET